ncbi:MULTISPECIES: S41 family peptidase [Oceanobacillus]|uniref:Peptidase S41 n=1 Tax=Oceanobacillus kimchii TaxID=746691 RepID=A0ABQ5TM59_9BACI|nr:MULTISPECIES: S41 family peptidase [Oceanobacillus]MBT2600115.1 peptidoglycan-binding protein [Oceanobacillus sp. ISL-74]MBT2650273.1 peptidoglycan-binding protein [Oceanobacillus sp. ISL-73]OEH55171.1 peptidase S41 [Oceanobacillus sp. E9]GLO67155.1 peptidase S41 [Oceanobacillus kimchii]
MKLNKKQIVLIFVGALLLGFIGAYAGIQLAQDNNQQTLQSTVENSSSNEDESNEQSELTGDLNKVSQAYDIIKENYLEDVEDKQLVEGAIEGMLATLDDQHTSYLDVEMMQQFNEQIESSFEGIGAEVSMVNGNVTIVSPMKGSPAEEAGLRPNDQVLTVDGESLDGLNLNEAVAQIRGEKGSEVVLEIQRAGVTEPFEVTIVRDTIPVETVYSETKEVDGKLTGIIEITNFSEKTGEEFDQQLNELENQEVEGLVIDVRGNPGGLLNVAEDILKHLVPKDLPILQIEDGEGQVEEVYSELEAKKDYPISVLIDEGSASASEILAVAMKDLGYDIVGESSYGKGTVQQAVPMGDGSSIKLTTLKWLSPKGEWINEEGVEPTIEEKQPEYYYSIPIQVEEPFSMDETSEEIANMQVMLSGLGYDTGRTDGYFDDQTEKAVKDFQADNDLEATGEVDTETGGLIESQLVEKIRNGEDDQQLDTSLEELYQ